jgi:SagB-type dehydrogenase family enzyme
VADEGQIAALSEIRLRRSRALVAFWREGEVVFYNFLLSRAFSGTSETLDLLSAAEEWRAPEFFFSRLPQHSPASLADRLFELIELGGLVAEGTAEGVRDQEYERCWDWGVPAGLYHFGIKYQRFATDEEARALLQERLAVRPQPPLTTENSNLGEVLQLPRPVPKGLLRVMVARRSERWFAREPIGSDQLCRCLYGGLGITGFIEDAELGLLPLKMAPSGGARNPYEGYVYVRRVNDVPTGIYHYSGLENSLGLLSPPPLPPPGKLLSDQDWADDAAAVLFLVANFERTAWKYPHPNSYRVVLIEAGHIVQNVLLLANEQGLAAAPTAALQEEPIEAMLELNPMGQGVIYAVALGVPADRRSFKLVDERRSRSGF